VLPGQTLTSLAAFELNSPLILIFILTLEAGGFEPPSRDISRQVSTCLVSCFDLISKAVQRQTALKTSL
jgi:hypothetical protein